MTGPTSAIIDEALRFFMKLSIRRGFSGRECLRRYRAAGGQVGDKRFYEIFDAVRREMKLSPVRAPGRYEYNVDVNTIERTK